MYGVHCGVASSQFGFDATPIGRSGWAHVIDGALYESLRSASS